MDKHVHIFTDDNKLINNINTFNIKFKKIKSLNIENISYVIINASKYYDIEKIINKYGYEGISIISNIYDDSPNMIYYKNENKLKDYISRISNYIKFKNDIKISFMNYHFEIARNNLVCIIPILGRHELLRKVVESLKDQKYKIIIVGVVSNEEDELFCKDEINIEVINIENSPLGRKFCFGIEFSKIYYPLGTIILGSDDILSPCYIKNIIKYIDEYDFIGLNHWGILNNDNIYKLKYRNNDRTIGSGRLFKYSLLNMAKWFVYNEKLEKNLDNSSDRIINAFGIKKLVISKSNYSIYSVKNKQQVITTIKDYKKSNKVIFL